MVLCMLDKAWRYIKDVGYTHVNIDDCWSEKNRSESGDLVPGMP